MQSRDLSELTVHPAPLVPLDPTKGASATPSAYVGIGGPITLPYAPSDEDDPQLRAFMNADHTHAYHLLLLRCTFDTCDEEPFDEALVRFRLACIEPVAGDPPIGWDAIPERATSDEGTLTTTTSMAAKAAVLGAEIGPGFNRTTTHGLQPVYAEIHGLLSPTPRWKLRRTPGRPLTGDQPLSLVVRAPLHPIIAELDVTASTVQRRLGLIPYRVDVPRQAATVLLVPPSAKRVGMPTG